MTAVEQASGEFHQLLREHRALLSQYGSVQARCSSVIAAQARRIAVLEAEAIRLRAAVITRDTALAVARENHASLEATVPGLPRRAALARKVESLVARVHELMRDRMRSQWRAEAASTVTTSDLPSDAPGRIAMQDTDLHAKAVLCVGSDGSAATAAQQLIEQAGGHFLHHDGEDQHDPAGLEASLIAADLVICQTGCVSHNAYWRVQDHCKRTGKPCVLVGQPQAMLFVRPSAQGSTVDVA
ncbi:MAG: DUF2325 domain-containing protein [Hyphomicrobiaceae bacterium]|nr:DUF2325 domain-containing protein [Hyphomicrobiaceae bacterium]